MREEEIFKCDIFDTLRSTLILLGNKLSLFNFFQVTGDAVQDSQSWLVRVVQLSATVNRVLSGLLFVTLLESRGDPGRARR